MHSRNFSCFFYFLFYWLNLAIGMDCDSIYVTTTHVCPLCSLCNQFTVKYWGTLGCPSRIKQFNYKEFFVSLFPILWASPGGDTTATCLQTLIVGNSTPPCALGTNHTLGPVHELQATILLSPSLHPYYPGWPK